MTLTNSNNNAGLNTSTLLALQKWVDITYDDDCKEVSGWNASNVDAIPISILNLKDQRSLTDLDREGSNFMWKALLIDCLISMDYDGYDTPDTLVKILKKKYEQDPGNLALIDEFDRTYKKTDAIRWYKEQSCIFQELNKALRFNCMNVILAYRFYMRDLAAHYETNNKIFRIVIVDIQFMFIVVNV